jgi:hypothetical protein
MRLMTVAREALLFGSSTKGRFDKVQDCGQRVNANCGFAQFTSGLWAYSQSVPKMMSWSPRDVT